MRLFKLLLGNPAQHSASRRTSATPPRQSPVLSPTFLISLVLWLWLSPGGNSGAAPLQNVLIAPKWGRFEKEFKSTIGYSNAFQEATLKVMFTSPLGETNTVNGFWDGGKTWRVRLSPNLPGRWLFISTCSDTANKGLHNQSGEFTCTANSVATRFGQHGPIRVAQDRRHLEHVDGTPFFWLADTVWNGAVRSESKDWDYYAHVRAAQKFTVAQWAVAPGANSRKQSAFTGDEHIRINPEFFRRLDARVETLSRAGIVSAIVPLLEIGSQSETGAALPDDQAALFVRYVAARWGADPVALLLAFDQESGGGGKGRWKRIGQAVFSSGAHPPVIVYTGHNAGLLEDFRDQNWVDIFGYQIVPDLTDAAIKSTVLGSFAGEWAKEPPRPVLPFLPLENAMGPQSQKRFGLEEVQRAAYWGLLMAPPAGLSYGAEGVAQWSGKEPAKQVEQKAGGKGRKSDEVMGADLPLWQKSLFLPAARQMMPHLTRFIESFDSWRLRPEAGFVAAQPGAVKPARYIAAAGNEAKDLSLVYVPEDRTVEVALTALPSAPAVTWFNPRTGESSPAVAVVGGETCQFPTPDLGDWVLVMKKQP